MADIVVSSDNGDRPDCGFENEMIYERSVLERMAKLINVVKYGCSRKLF